jgi:DNA-binding NtrC family response regulator
MSPSHVAGPRLFVGTVEINIPIYGWTLFRSDPDRFDLVITDMTMPQLTGEDLVQEILKIKPGIPIIICTGYNDKITEAVSKKIGAKGLLMKPFGINELAAMIRNVIGKNNGDL